jgi:phage terminase large subunit-like protein
MTEIAATPIPAPPAADAPPAALPYGGQARRTPNTSMTEADWAEAMRLFCEEGLSDAKIGLRFNLSNNTIARHRSNHGIERAAWPVVKAPSARPLPLYPAGPGPLPVAEPTPIPIPLGEDPRAVSRLLRGLGAALVAEGRVPEAGVYFRAARQVLSAASAEAAFEAPFIAAPGQGAGEGVGPGEGAPVLRPAQCAPLHTEAGEPWKTWLFLGGRGAGKTLAGAAWLAAQAKVCTRLALVGPTYSDVREVMIEGPSGLRGAAAAFGPANADGSIARPRYEPSRRRLVWPNGSVAQVFTAEEPDGLRGPQFEAAWGDELCAWSDPKQVLAMLRMGLRLGEDPRLMLTTTPSAGPVLRGLLAEPGLVVTRGSALDNAAHLAPGFVERLRGLYGGTRLERQEIDGEVIEALEGAVFHSAGLEVARALGADGVPARFERLVVAVDPPAGIGGSACGIVVAGMLSEHRAGGPRAWVLRDDTVHGLSVGGWAARVAAAAKWAAGLGFTQVVAEANQGGEMVRQVLVQAGVDVPIRLVHAKVGKAERAEPVALLYEQGRVAHAPGLVALEDQMLLLGSEGPDTHASPDRADALVWALSSLVIFPHAEPRVRWL